MKTPSRIGIGVAVLGLVIFQSVRRRNELAAAWIGCARLETIAKTKHFSTLSGSLLPVSLDRWELRNPRLRLAGGWEDVNFSADVHVQGEGLGRAPYSGHEVAISGPFHCQVPYRNPGGIEDGLQDLKPPRLFLTPGTRMRVVTLSSRSVWEARFVVGFREFLKNRLVGYPGVLGFIVAVWTGDSSGLPEPLRKLYLEGGLLQILALSGQHVVGLVGLVAFFSQVGLRAIWAASLDTERQVRIHVLYRRWLKGLPLFAATLLYVTGSGSPSMRRTLCMVISAYLLRIRGWNCSPLQCAASSVAIQLAWSPGSVGQPGFFLSAAATFLLCVVMDSNEMKSGGRAYIFLGIALPILVLPLSLFFFARAAWFAPVTGLLIAWIWDLVVIPIGFLAPLVMVGLPTEVGSSVFAGLEAAWRWFVLSHGQMEDVVLGSYRVFVRPRWGELFLWEALLLTVVLALRRKLFRRTVK